MTESFFCFTFSTKLYLLFMHNEYRIPIFVKEFEERLK